MAKSKPFWEQSWFMPLIGIIALVYFINSVNQLGGLGRTVYVTNTTIIQRLQQPTDTDPSCSVTLSKNIACTGEEVTATITDGAGEQCLLFFNYEREGWEYIGPVTLNPYGILTLTRAQEIAGEYQFGVICGDCVKLTTLYVRPCDDDSDDDGEDDGGDDLVYTCGQGSDVDKCYGTCPSDYPVCAPVEFNTYDACVCLNEGSMMVHPDWKPGGIYHNPQEEDEEAPPPACSDTDGLNPFTVGYVTYDGHTYPDVCHAGWPFSVDEYRCVDDKMLKSEIQCPNDDCSGGKCQSGTTTVFQQCYYLGFDFGGCYSGGTEKCTRYASFDYLCDELNDAYCCYY